MKMKKYDVTALGELLVDFTENGISPQGNLLFEANPGGAPGNVLAMLQKLGRKTAFIGKVGKDFFGEQLKAALEETGISAEGLRADETTPTTLAFVRRLADGDRDFSFYRKPGADLMLTEAEVPEELIKSARIFHFGTLSMTAQPARQATKRALETARKNGVPISFDPNLRPPLWDSMEEARRQVLEGLGYCDILKISDNEISWLTGRDDMDRAAEWIQERFPGIKWIFLSLGKLGSRGYAAGVRARAEAFLREDTRDTTGAGDTFMGCMLHQLLERGMEPVTEQELQEMLLFANAAASLITARKGALRVMPEKKDILELLQQSSQGSVTVPPSNTV